MVNDNIMRILFIYRFIQSTTIVMLCIAKVIMQKGVYRSRQHHATATMMIRGVK